MILLFIVVAVVVAAAAVYLAAKITRSRAHDREERLARSQQAAAVARARAAEKQRQIWDDSGDELTSVMPAIKLPWPTQAPVEDPRGYPDLGQDYPAFDTAPPPRPVFDAAGQDYPEFAALSPFRADDGPAEDPGYQSGLAGLVGQPEPARDPAASNGHARPQAARPQAAGPQAAGPQAGRPPAARPEPESLGQAPSPRLGSDEYILPPARSAPAAWSSEPIRPPARPGEYPAAARDDDFPGHPEYPAARSGEYPASSYPAGRPGEHIGVGARPAGPAARPGERDAVADRNRRKVGQGSHRGGHAKRRRG